MQRRAVARPPSAATGVGPICEYWSCRCPQDRRVAAKDTPRGESTLSSDVLDLLAAIRDHVDMPLPSNEPADERAASGLMRQRLTDLHVSLSVALSAKWIGIFDPAAEAASIRERTAAAPVTYALWQPGCGVCRRPFDPDDTRHDGGARHGDTPFCRACVDRCHDSEIADHRCPICAGGDAR